MIACQKKNWQINFLASGALGKAKFLIFKKVGVGSNSRKAIDVKFSASFLMFFLSA